MQTHPSEFWTDYFAYNAKQHRVDWRLTPQIKPHQRKRVLKSLQAWQLGETSDGAHLLAAARKYARAQNDYLYPVAVGLFIKEEQKHGNNLGRYLDLIGEKRIKKDWGDTLFRKIRYFNSSMELWTLAVITVESVAQIFYQALKDATDCPLLREICDDILIDEERHIDFQTERMLAIYRTHNAFTRPVFFHAYRFFFFATASTVWLAHRKVLRIETPTFFDYLKAMGRKFDATFGKIKHAVRLDEMFRTI